MTADPEAAETYLRLLAETELRQAVRSKSYLDRDRQRRVRYAGLALAAAGAIDPRVADSIAQDVESALALRDPSPATSVLRRIHSMPMMAASGGLAPRLSAPASSGALRATAVGQMFRLSDESSLANLWVLSVVRASVPDFTWCATVTLVGGLSQGSSPRARVPRLRAIDDRGRSYGVHYSGGFPAGGWATGWLSIHPAVPDGVAWIDLYTHLDTPRIRLDLAAGATPAQVTVDPADPASPGERLLDAIALSMLTQRPVPAMDDIVAALEAADVLPPGSLAPGRLAAICPQKLGTVPADSALLAADLPEPWTSVLAHSVRRHKPPVKHAAAPLAVVLPELDGIRFVLAGLRSEADQSLLSVLAEGLPSDNPGGPLGAPFSQWFPWWIRDSAGQWHIAQADGHQPGMPGMITMALRVTPPLPRSVTRLDVIITGRSARITATVPVDWVTG